MLSAEAGFSLGELYRLFLPRGYFSPVAPGTRHVTLGGMVAADIHGKNHHVSGTFGRHVRSLRMRVGDGRVLECSREQHADLFRATLGGMGLTGHILKVDVQLERIETPWIYEESERKDTLEEVFASLREASASWPMTVAWIDTSSGGSRMGRGIVMRGRWATAEEAPRRPHGPILACACPSTSRPAWPTRHVRLGQRALVAQAPPPQVRHVVAPEPFFWVLDLVDQLEPRVRKRGFTQYQCVLPSSVEVFRGFLELFQQLGASSFVTVLKDCGEQGEGLISSFPRSAAPSPSISRCAAPNTAST